MSPIDMNVVLAAVFTLLGALGTQLVTTAAERVRRRSEIRDEEWLSWRRGHLARLAESLVKVQGAVDILLNCGLPAPDACECTKQELFDEHDVASETVDEAETTLVSAAVFTPDEPLERAVEAVGNALMKLRKTIPTAREFRDGGARRDIRPSVEASIEVETAIKASFWRIEQLATGARIRMSLMRRWELARVLNGSWFVPRLSSLEMLRRIKVSSKQLDDGSVQVTALVAPDSASRTPTTT